MTRRIQVHADTGDWVTHCPCCADTGWHADHDDALTWAVGHASRKHPKPPTYRTTDQYLTALSYALPAGSPPCR